MTMVVGKGLGRFENEVVDEGVVKGKAEAFEIGEMMMAGDCWGIWRDLISTWRGVARRRSAGGVRGDYCCG